MKIQPILLRTFLSAAVALGLLAVAMPATARQASPPGVAPLFSTPNASPASVIIERPERQRPQKDSGWIRPLYLEIPEGSRGPCGDRARCQLIAMIAGQMTAGQMMRAPGRASRLWWFQPGPMVSGTKISAINGVQGSGHYLHWHSVGDDGALELRERERTVVRFQPPSADVGANHQPYTPEGDAPLSPDSFGLRLDLPMLPPTPQQTVTVRGPLSGPIAGGHTVVIDWKRGNDTLVRETRLVRAFVLQDDSYLLQADSLLHNRGRQPLDFAGAEGEPAAWRIDWLGSPTEKVGKTLHPPSTADAARTEPPRWIAQQRSVGERRLTFVLFADPNRPTTPSINGNSFSAPLDGALGAAKRRRTSVRLWIVNGWDVTATEIEEQADAYYGVSWEPTDEELDARKKESGSSPW